MSLPARIVVTTICSIGLVWLLRLYLGGYFVLTGGYAAWITVGALLTLMNMTVRPILDIATLPLRFFATFLAIVIANGIFLWIAVKIVEHMDAKIVTLKIEGGLVGWIVLSFALGFAHWVIKELQRDRG